MIGAIAPWPAEVVAAKLVRRDQKDIDFAALCLRFGLAGKVEIKQALTKALQGAELDICLQRVDLAARRGSRG